MDRPDCERERSVKLQGGTEALGTISLGLAILAIVLFLVSFCINYNGPFERAPHAMMMYALWASLVLEPLALFSGLIALDTKRGRVALYVVVASLVLGYLAFRFPLMFDQWRSVEAPRSRPAHMNESGPGRHDRIVRAAAGTLFLALGCIGIVLYGLAVMMSRRLPPSKKEITEWCAACLGSALIVILVPVLFLGPDWLIDFWHRLSETIDVFRPGLAT